LLIAQAHRSGCTHRKVVLPSCRNRSAASLPSAGECACVAARTCAGGRAMHRCGPHTPFLRQRRVAESNIREWPIQRSPGCGQHSRRAGGHEFDWPGRAGHCTSQLFEWASRCAPFRHHCPLCVRRTAAASRLAVRSTASGMAPWPNVLLLAAAGGRVARAAANGALPPCRKMPARAMACAAAEDAAWLALNNRAAGAAGAAGAAEMVDTL
jgi:hypothetical protein